MTDAPHSAGNSDDNEPQIPLAVLARMQEDSLVLQAHTLDRTDDGAAERVFVYYGEKLRYVKQLDQWRLWDGRRWLNATSGDMMRVSRMISRLIGREVGEHNDDDQRRAHAVFARNMASVSRMQAMIKTATGDKRLWQDPEEFDRDIFLVNFLNGTYDVRLGELREHRQEDCITTLVAHEYHSDRPAEQWKGLVRRVFKTADKLGEEDATNETYLFAQLVLGYSLLGANPEHKIFFFSGAARCGKSKMLEIVRDILGYEVAHQARIDLIAKQNRGHHTSEQFSLIGKRVVTISETPDTFSLDENRVKSLTGDNVATVYALYTGIERITPTTWSIHIATNNLPNVVAWDDAIKERVVIIPCGPTVPPRERIQNLDDIIKNEEAEGVVAWLVEGLRRWYVAATQQGKDVDRLSQALEPPLSVEVASAVFESENDPIGAFIEDNIEITGDTNDVVHRSLVLERAKHWKSRGEGAVIARNKLYSRIIELPGVMLTATREFSGIRLRDTSELTDTQRDWARRMKNGE